MSDSCAELELMVKDGKGWKKKKRKEEEDEEEEDLEPEKVKARDPVFDRRKWARFADRHFKNFPKPGVVQYRKWELYHLVDWTCEQLDKEPSLLAITPPIYIVGDIHGLFDDLLRMFMTLGPPPQNRYLFLGDYVDRGPQDIECIALLLTYKCLYPEKVYLLRGNHEVARTNERWGFKDNMQRRFKNLKLYRHIHQAFDRLPICACISEKILCMHGGLSKELEALQQIRDVQRPMEHTLFHPMVNDILWSDPEVGMKGWKYNENRRTSCIFGKDALEEKLKKMDLELIVRGHQVCQEGYRFFGNRKLVTVFSAPKYGGNMNQAAVVKVDSSLVCSFTFFCPKETYRKIKSRGDRGLPSKGGKAAPFMEAVPAKSLRNNKTRPSRQSISASSKEEQTGSQLPKEKEN